MPWTRTANAPMDRGGPVKPAAGQEALANSVFAGTLRVEWTNSALYANRGRAQLYAGFLPG
jgi:hypothetical protein